MVMASIEYPQSVKLGANDAAVAPPHVTVVEICDPTMAEEEIEVINQNLIQLRSEPLHARRVVVRLQSTALVYHSTNLAVRTRTVLSPNLIGFVVFGPEAAGTINGLLICPDLMLMATAGTEGRFVVEPGYESISVCFSPTDLMAHLKARKQWDGRKPQRAVELLVCDVTKTRALFTLGKRLAVTAAQRPDLFNENQQVLAAAEVEVVEMLLAAICSSENYSVTRSDRTHQTHSQVVRLAEEYVLTHTNIQLFVTDLCKAAAVSERTLEYAFREILGMSPIAFLQRLRLHRVRQALRMGTRGTTTVSTEALKWGFWHFGDFSKAYKECFGESPSDTLRREPVSRGA